MIKLPLKAENINVEPHHTTTNLTLWEDAYRLAREILRSEIRDFLEANLGVKEWVR